MPHAALARIVLLIATLAALAPATPARADGPFDAKRLIYNMVGAMLVEGATGTGEVGVANGAPFVPQDAYAATDPVINRSYSPVDGVTCYPKQGKCFDQSGAFDSSWTHTLFGK